MNHLWPGLLILVPFCACAAIEGDGDSIEYDPTAPASPVGIAPVPLRDPVADLFLAVATADLPVVEQLLDAGVDVNSTLARPAAPELLSRFKDTTLEFYLTVEAGLTPLMLASAMGYTDLVKLLLSRGANRHAVTKTHRTFALWLAGRNGHVEVMQLLLDVEPESEAGRSKIHISLADQTAWFWKDGQIVRTFPVSTGRKRMPTPKGRFVVTDKYKEWKSTLYPARMPYFLRFSCRDFGMHAGALPGYPASHGCIRIPAADAKALFAEVAVGTMVEIE